MSIFIIKIEQAATSIVFCRKVHITQQYDVMKVREKFDDKCIFFYSQKILFFVFNFSSDLFCFSIHMIRYEQEKMYVIERLCKYTIRILQNFRLFTAFFVFIAKTGFLLFLSRILLIDTILQHIFILISFV